MLTLAGWSQVESGKMLPWYHRVLVEPALCGEGSFAAGLLGGEAVRVEGRLDHHKFLRTDGSGKRGAVVRVRATSLVPMSAAELGESSLMQVEGDRPHVTLYGARNEVTLLGNLTGPAGAFESGPHGSYVKVSLAVEGARSTWPYVDPEGKRKHFFTLKAWRETGVPLMGLAKAARLSVRGMLLSERFQDAQLVWHEAVTVEVLASRTA